MTGNLGFRRLSTPRMSLSLVPLVLALVPLQTCPWTLRFSSGSALCKIKMALPSPQRCHFYACFAPCTNLCHFGAKSHITFWTVKRVSAVGYFGGCFEVAYFRGLFNK